jgi:hypothetical protein
MDQFFTLDVNVFTFVFLLFMFLGLQLQIRRISKKIDELAQRK